MSHLLKSVEDGVMKIVFNRPEAMNALSRDMMMGLQDALTEAAGSRDIGCVVVRGAGDKAFCAGGDVKSMAAGRDQEKTYEDKVHDIRMRMQVSELLHEMGKPTIAMVNGVAAGAGLSLALACDLRVAGQSARFIQIFARIGLMPDAGSTWFLPRLVGPERARLMAMTGDAIDAATAAAWNLALEVAPDEALMERARGLADRLAAGPTRAIGAIRRALDAAESNTLAEQLALEANMQQVLAGTRDFEEGVAAFAQKRKAAFEGR